MSTDNDGDIPVKLIDVDDNDTTEKEKVGKEVVEEEYCIGIDFGTTNCTASIYSRTLGRSKWMRLSFLYRTSLVSSEKQHQQQHDQQSDTTTTTDNKHMYIHDIADQHMNQNNDTKVGRIVPSTILFATTEYLNQFQSNFIISQSTQQVQQQYEIRIMKWIENNNDNNNNNNTISYYVWQNVTDLIHIFPSQEQQSSRIGKGTLSLWACVGSGAEILYSKLLSSLLQKNTSKNNSSSSSNDNSNNIHRAIIRSVKRILLQEFNHHHNHSNYSSEKMKTVYIPIQPLGYNATTTTTTNNNDSHEATSSCSINIDTRVIVATLLRSIRIASLHYLQQRKVRQKLGLLPLSRSNSSSSTTVTKRSSVPIFHCCIGVPVTASILYRTYIQSIAYASGYTSCTCITESTAAAIAYGLSFITTTTSSTIIDTSSDIDKMVDAQLSQHSQQHKDELNIKANKQDFVVKQTIFVFDMGGGTTDITIAEQQQQQNQDNDINSHEAMEYKVCVTMGNDQLGGDDMDNAILYHVLDQLQQKQQQESNTALPNIRNTSASSNIQQNQHILHQCRIAKLLLCGDPDKDIAPVDYTDVHIPIQQPQGGGKIAQSTIRITQKEFEMILQPIIVATRHLMQSAIDEYYRVTYGETDVSDPSTQSPSNITDLIDEVILIGGASRVPYIRKLLHDMFVNVQKTDDVSNDESCTSTTKIIRRGGVKELCTSVNAMSAVSQGCAVSVAISSGTVPLHEIKSAYMLDTIPYSIGVLVNCTNANNSTQPSNACNRDTIIDFDESSKSVSNFVEILPRGMVLPAANFATFVLADVLQKGITVLAVERIIGSSEISDTQHPSSPTTIKYNTIGEFTFLLHRLSKEQLQQLSMNNNNARSIDVGMTLKENGEFVVSIFDINDPDHARKKEWYQKAKMNSNKDITRNVDNKQQDINDPWTWEQISLIVSCIIVFVVYVIAKMSFIQPTNQYVST